MTRRARSEIADLLATEGYFSPRIDTHSEAGGAGTSLLIAAAGTILGGQPGGITSQILTVGKRLSDRAWLGYEQGLTAATGTLKFTYALTPRISLVTRAGGDNAVDVFYNFHFD